MRIIAGRSGRVIFQTELVLRFNYGASVPWVDRLDDGTINAIAGPERLVLRTPASLYGEDLKTVGELTVEAGQSIPFVLSYGSSFQTPPLAIDPFQSLERTEAFWRQWSDRCPGVGPWTEAVKRCGTLKSEGPFSHELGQRASWGEKSFPVPRMLLVSSRALDQV